MGIENIDILKPDGFPQAPQVRERKAVSQHTMIMGLAKVPCETFDYESDKAAEYQVDTNLKWADLKWVFGWDSQLQSFYLQVHDAFAEDYDANPVLWFGATQETAMPEVADLVTKAYEYGLDIPASARGMLQAEKDRGL
jgi:hypothetical protein